MIPPWYSDARVWLGHADCRDVLATLPDACVDAVVCDPPYEYGFMGRSWDRSGIAYSVELWEQVLRVLKPGGHALVFGGTRTYHRMACAVEDAGFEIRDSVLWLYGSGFPKSLNVGKAIDKAAGAERVMRVNERWAERYPNGPGGNLSNGDRSEHFNQLKHIADGPLLTSDPVTPEAQQWDGWGTALKPAHEPIVVARKPFKGTVAGNAQEWGTGALNIDGCRIGSNGVPGRWPANVVLGHSEGCVEVGVKRVRGTSIPAAAPTTAVRRSGAHEAAKGHQTAGRVQPVTGHADADGMETVEDWRCEPSCPVAELDGRARFFYCAKPSKAERPQVDGVIHPTCKPLALMRWLVRLVTPPSGTVLDPFAGSGTTVEACLVEGFRCLAVEAEEKYLPLVKVRVDRAARVTGESPVGQLESA